jgi:hypothetical protein
MDYTTKKYHQAQNAYHFALSELCSYIRTTIDSTNNEDWPDGMLTRAMSVLSLCQVAHDYWRAGSFDDALLVGNQAILLMEEMTTSNVRG